MILLSVSVAIGSVTYGVRVTISAGLYDRLFSFPYSYFKVPRFLCTFLDQLLLGLIDDPEKLRDGYLCPALIVQMQDAVQVSLHVLYRDFHLLLIDLLGNGADMDRIFAD